VGEAERIVLHRHCIYSGGGGLDTKKRQKKKVFL